MWERARFDVAEDAMWDAYPDQVLTENVPLRLWWEPNSDVLPPSSGWINTVPVGAHVADDKSGIIFDLDGVWFASIFMIMAFGDSDRAEATWQFEYRGASCQTRRFVNLGRHSSGSGSTYTADAWGWVIDVFPSDVGTTKLTCDALMTGLSPGAPTGDGAHFILGSGNDWTWSHIHLIRVPATPINRGPCGPESPVGGYVPMIKTTHTIVHTTDAAVVLNRVSHTTDFELLAPTEVTLSHTTDASLTGSVKETHTTDAYLSETYTDTYEDEY